MKIAILANRARSFVRPMADGLKEMFDLIGVEASIFYQGLVDIANYSISNPTRSLKDQLITPYRDLKYSRLLNQLQNFDVIVVVGHAPNAFMNHFLRDESLRRSLPHVPIVLYDLVYLPTRGLWGKYLKEGSVEHGIPTGGHYGLERYDYYLCASVVSESPMPAGTQPYSLIGLKLDRKTLFASQKPEFIALLDFERPDHQAERQIQIQALEATQTQYIELKGSYSLETIRELYRRCSIYLIAHRESFGLPICELQACGSYIFTPYSHWCPSHWLKADLSQAGAGDLPPNFVVYDNDLEKLTQAITHKKRIYKADLVRQNFQDHHPHLLHGDLDELQSFVERLKISKIHSRSHQEYRSIPCLT
jgi:glycosyltransferase involved in cell wall biosynthesis